MSFLNPALLLGLLAVAVPIALHLLARRSSSAVPWGATMFLAAAERRRRRQVALEDVVLLVCRCLVPVVAALAFARPFASPEASLPWALVAPPAVLAAGLAGVSAALGRRSRGRRAAAVAAIACAALAIAAAVAGLKFDLSRFGGGARQDVAVIVDGSASMTLPGPDGRSNFECAVEEVEKLVESAPRGTAFSFFIGGPVPEILVPVPISDRRALGEAIRCFRAVGGTMRAAPALAAAAVSLSSGHNPAKRIFVFGDGQTEGWDIGEDGRWDGVKQLFSRFRTPPRIVWRTLPMPASMRNLALASIDVSETPFGTDRPVPVRVEVLNSGTEPVTPASVSLECDGIRQSIPGSSQILPGRSQSFSFESRFSTPGAHVLSASIAGGDDLAADDSATRVVSVSRRLPVLIADGDDGLPRRDRASTYLALALAPGGAGMNALFEPVVEDAARVASRVDFSGFPLVALCNMPRLSPACAAALAAHVRMGGGLLVLPGARSRPEFWNGWTDGGRMVLPAALGEWRAAGASEAALDPATFSPAALHGLRVGTDLGQVSPSMLWSLAPEAAPAAGGGASSGIAAAASSASGVPLLAFHQFGRGTVALSAFPFDPGTSGLPARRAFVPFVQCLAGELARAFVPTLNLSPGDGASVELGADVGGGASGFGAGSGAGAGGLLGRYYPKLKFEGEPVARIDSQLDATWGGEPMRGFPRDYFSVVWSGKLLPPSDGDYVFRMTCDDRGIFSLGDRRMATVRDWRMPSTTPPVHLHAGRPVPLEFRFEEDGGNAVARLEWREPGASEFSVVPQSAFVPDSTTAVEVEAPDGDVFLAELGIDAGGRSIRVARPLFPGLYRCRAPEGGFPASLSAAIASDGTIPFCVSSGAGESRLDAISAGNSSWLRRFVPLALATDPEDAATALRGGALGNEFGWIFLVVLLALLVAEVALARWVSVRRREGEEPDVDFSNEGEAGRATFRAALKTLRRASAPADGDGGTR